MLQLMGWLGFLLVATNLAGMVFSRDFKDDDGKLSEWLVAFLVAAFAALAYLATLFVEQAEIYEELMRDLY